MRFLSALFGFGSKGERKEAQRLGITVSEITRDLPHFSRYGNQITLKPGRCVRYVVSRQAQEPKAMWSLLQRSKDLGATFPNEYLLTNTGRLSGDFEEQLRRVAEEFAEELFEFEGTATDVAVYWEEWGGPTKVRTLHEVLGQLAQW